MAIFHHHETVISRSKGRSSIVQVAAYITGQKIEETRRNLIEKTPLFLLLGSIIVRLLYAIGYNLKNTSVSL